MSDCPMISRCPFFHDRMAGMVAMASVMKMVYCRGSNLNCARWAVCSALGPSGVPADLFPNEIERARNILDAADVQRATGKPAPCQAENPPAR